MLCPKVSNEIMLEIIAVVLTAQLVGGVPGCHWDPLAPLFLQQEEEGALPWSFTLGEPRTVPNVLGFFWELSTYCHPSIPRLARVQLDARRPHFFNVLQRLWSRGMGCLLSKLEKLSWQVDLFVHHTKTLSHLKGRLCSFLMKYHSII